MKSTEDYSVRLKMVSMHQFFIDKVDDALDSDKYFEASWLIYSCLENRYFRVLDKYKRKCRYCVKGGKCRKGSNKLAISTKISCVERLAKRGVECAKPFSGALIEDTRAWIKRRNRLMHNLLSLEDYQDKFDSEFKKLAIDGKAILEKTYAACSEFRAIFYRDDYVFEFPEECMEACLCAINRKESKGNV